MLIEAVEIQEFTEIVSHFVIIAMQKQLSPKEFKEWKDTLISVILDPNDNCTQGAFRRILNSVSGYAGIEITIAEPRQRIGIKAVEIKLLPVSSSEKIARLKKYIENDIYDPRINKEELREPWIVIYNSEDKNNQKTNIWLDGEDAKNILAKMMYDCLIELDDRHEILKSLINEAINRINELKKAMVINKSVQGAPDGSGESYQIIDGQRILGSLAYIYISCNC